MNKYDLMRDAMREARDTMNAADNCANEMAQMLKGRLRKVSPYVAAELKRELRNLNMHTKRWND